MEYFRAPLVIGALQHPGSSTGATFPDEGGRRSIIVALNVDCASIRLVVIRKAPVVSRTSCNYC